MNSTLIAKATSRADASDSVLVSFDSQWKDAIQGKCLTAFIRKRLPKTISPIWVYAYCGTPVASILARFRVKRIANITVDDALKVSEKLLMSPKQVSDYCEGHVAIGICEISEVQLAREPMHLQKLRSLMSFYPPQSFIILSKGAFEKINVECFPSSAKGR